MKSRIGDLGCSGIDTEKWQANNRVPLFPGKMNRWLLARTLRDNPEPTDIRNTLLAVFNKWFEGSPIDPVLADKGGAPGVVDNVRIVRRSLTPISLSNVARRREDLPGELPTVNGANGVLWLEVEFACRAMASSMPWPVRTAPGVIGVQVQSSARCPINADWILLEAGKPLAEAPPEVPITNILAQATGEVIADTLDTAGGAAGALLAPLFWPLVIGGAAVALYFHFTTKR